MHVVGLFDDATDGQAVVHDLEAAGFDSGNIELNSSNAGVLVGRLTNVGVPENDANVYAEGVRRGGSVVIVHTQTDDQAQQAADIMNRHNSVDIVNRGTEYRSAGWTRFDEDVDYSVTTDRDTAYVDRDTTSAETTGVRADTALRGTTQPSDEAVIPVVEEELRVKRRSSTSRHVSSRKSSSTRMSRNARRRSRIRCAARMSMSMRPRGNPVALV
jgi:hypothetical protein